VFLRLFLLFFRFFFFFFFFFFFQAEDGIRALYVTGVQTCALPIYPLALPVGPVRAARARSFVPAEPEPAQRADCRIYVFAGNPRPVGVLDPQHERPAGPARERPVVQIGRASCRERLEVAGGAGGVT